MTRNQAAAAIARAIGAAHAAYWAACDAEGRAIDPAALDAPEGLLDEAYEAAFWWRDALAMWIQMSGRNFGFLVHSIGEVSFAMVLDSE